MPANYNPLNEHAEYLREFWRVYGLTHRWQQSPHGKYEVIAGLRVAGEKYIFYSIKGASPELRDEMRLNARRKFDKVKDLRNRYKFKRGYQCLACGAPPNVRHHIIWLKNGGRNCKVNICYLCNTCHAEVHPWLKQKS